MNIILLGKKYKVFIDKGLENSYVDKTKKELHIRRYFDIVHEILHVLFTELDLAQENEEFLVTFLSENIEKMIIDNKLDAVISFLL